MTQEKQPEKKQEGGAVQNFLSGQWSFMKPLSLQILLPFPHCYYTDCVKSVAIWMLQLRKHTEERKLQESRIWSGPSGRVDETFSTQLEITSPGKPCSLMGFTLAEYNLLLWPGNTGKLILTMAKSND